MKSRVIFALIVVFVVSLFLVPGARAKQSKPLQSIVSMKFGYPGDTYGYQIAWQVSNPALTGPGSYDHRRMLLYDAPSDDKYVTRLEIGVEKVRANETDPQCGETFSQDTLLYYTTGDDLTGSHIPGQCDQVPSADINTNTRFTINAIGFHTGCPYAGYWEFYNTDHAPPYTNIYRCMPSSQDPEYNQATMSETYYGDIVGHREWGVHVTQNEWEHGSGVFEAQTSPSGNHTIGCSGVGCPVKSGIMAYWEDGHYPADKNPLGGIMDICIYQTYGGYPQCTFGK